jgi:hypothetical protein
MSNKPSDKEFKLYRKIKDLEEQNEKLKNQVIQLEKRLEKEQTPIVKKKGKEIKKHENACPLCEAPMKITDLPFGKLKICSAACGWKKVEKND